MIYIGDIFYNDIFHDGDNRVMAKFLDHYLEDEVYKRQPTGMVDVTLIVPTQLVINPRTLEDVSDVGNDTGAYLVESNGLFYVIDGHHRIASEILREVKSVKAFIYKL